MNHLPTKTFLAIALLMTTNFFAHAVVWRVNSTPGINASYTTLQAAHDGAAPGDTLYVESSKNSYGNLSLTKPLVIIGVGYFLAENYQTQASSTTSLAGNISFLPNAEGSVLTGLTLSGILKIKTSDITIKRNHLPATGIILNDSALAGYSITNIIISQNYVYSIADGTGNSGASNVMITNNIITNSLTLNLSSALNVYNNYINSSVTVKNGIFRNNCLNYSGAAVFSNTTIQNNLFYASSYNLNTSTTTDTVNKFSITFTTIFANTGSPDGKFQLKTTSPAIGYAADGGNCGPFGGPAPYVLSGIPSIPTIYDFIAAPSGNSTNGLNVNIKAKSRQ